MNQNLVQRETEIIDGIIEIKKSDDIDKENVFNLIKRTQKFYLIILITYAVLFLIQLFIPVISVANIFSSLIFSKGQNFFMFVSPTNLPFWIYFQLVKLGISCLFFLITSWYFLMNFFKLRNYE